MAAAKKNVKKTTKPNTSKKKNSPPPKQGHGGELFGLLVMGVAIVSFVVLLTTGSDNTLFENVAASPENTASVIRGISSYAPMAVGAQIMTSEDFISGREIRDTVNLARESVER